MTFHFVVDDFASAIRQARGAAGDKNVMLFGASMAQLGLATGLADEIQLHLVPLLLGGGIRLFAASDTGPIQLVRKEVIESSKVTDLRFRIASSG